jgi:hypothetical protein
MLEDVLAQKLAFPLRFHEDMSSKFLEETYYYCGASSNPYLTWTLKVHASAYTQSVSHGNLLKRTNMLLFTDNVAMGH